MDKQQLKARKRAVLYARVSTDEQADRGYSLPTQIEACGKYANNSGFEIVGGRYFDAEAKKLVDEPNDNTLPFRCYVDDYTGTIPLEERPEGRKAFTMLKSGEADCLLALSIDRIARPPEDGNEWKSVLLILGLARLGKEIHTVNRGELKSDFGGLLNAVVDFRSAGEERRKIIERTQRGRKAKANAGRVVGGGAPPYGYRFEYTVSVNQRTGTKTIVVTGLSIDEEEADIVRIIYHWYTVDLLTGHEIAKRPSERHVPTPGESRGRKRKRNSGVWRHNAVYSILKSEVYCGIWQYGKYDYNRVKDRVAKPKRRPAGEAIDVPVKAIISRQTWEKAQQRRKDGAGASKRRYLYLLAGRIKCGCGYSMIGNSNSQGIRYFRCGSGAHRFNSVEQRTCFGRPIRADLIECIAWNFALQAKKSGAEFTAMLKEYQEQQHSERAPLDGQIKEVKNLIETASRRIKRLASLMGNATDDDESAQYQTDLDAAKRDKMALERNLKKLEASYRWEDTITDDDIIAMLAMREADIAKLQKATFEDMRRYLAKIDLRVEVKERIATITCKLPVPARIADLNSGFELCASCGTASRFRGRARGSRRYWFSTPSISSETRRPTHLSRTRH